MSKKKKIQLLYVTGGFLLSLHLFESEMASTVSVNHTDFYTFVEDERKFYTFHSIL